MNLQIEIEELDPTLQAFLDCRSRFAGIMGPLGSGKTYTAILRILLGMIEQEPNARESGRAAGLLSETPIPI